MASKSHNCNHFSIKISSVKLSINIHLNYMREYTYSKPFFKMLYFDSLLYFLAILNLLLFNFQLYEFRFSDWLICTTSVADLGEGPGGPSPPLLILGKKKKK